MALKGSLEDMAVADLIQHNCLDNKTSRLVIENDGKQAILFFKGGAVIDATLGNLRGEEAIYRLLTWQDGAFTLETGHEAPKVTINSSWSGLLLEGARLIDEGNHKDETNGVLSNLDSMFSSEPEPKPKKKSEHFSEIINQFVEEGTEIEGAAVIGLNGLIYAAKMSQSVEKDNSIGPTWAEIFDYSCRSVKQFERGAFKQTLIQGNRGNIIIADLDEELIFVGLIPADVNLGIVLSEARIIAEKIQSLL